MTDTIQLTPQGIPTTSFADKAKELENVLTKKTELEAEIATSETAIRKLFYTNNMPKDVREASDLMGLEDKLTVYVKKETKQVQGLVYTAAKAEGRAFSEIVSNPPLMKMLEKQFGAKFQKFFRDVDDVFHMKEINTPDQIDEDKTAALKTEYMTLTGNLMDKKIQLKTQEQKVKNIKEYIEFCKSIVSLAPTPQKGGGDKGQQGGQQKGN